MWKLVSLGCAAALALHSFAAESTPVAGKKSPAKKGVATVHKKSAASPSTATRTAAAKRAKSGKKGPVRPATTWRNRQLAPSAERYKEIQQALAAKGYLPTTEANGKWSDTSTEALRKFQADQNLDGNGKINSLSLIALGLGPKRENPPSAKP